MVVGWLIVVDFIVMFFPSKATWCPFSQLASLAQQLRSSGTPLVQAVQAASASVTTSLSLSVPGGGNISCKFNFGVGTGGGGELGGDGRLEAS